MALDTVWIWSQPYFNSNAYLLKKCALSRIAIATVKYHDQLWVQLERAIFDQLHSTLGGANSHVDTLGVEKLWGEQWQDIRGTLASAVTEDVCPCSPHLSLLGQLHMLGKELCHLRWRRVGELVGILRSGAGARAFLSPSRTGRFSVWQLRRAFTTSVHRTAVLHSTMRRGVPGSSACFPAVMASFFVRTAGGGGR